MSAATRPEVLPDVTGIGKELLVVTTSVSPSPLEAESPSEKPSWRSVATRRKHEVNSTIPTEWRVPSDLLESKSTVDLVKKCGLLTEREVTIVYDTAVDLLQKLRERKYTAVEVTTAFCKAAAIAHQATNCLAWTMFTTALAKAKSLDAYMEEHGVPIGPLHGLPISVKEHLYLKDTPSTSGFVAWANDFCETEDREGVCVKMLRDAGAVFHVKTTNPQGLMELETDSNLYGVTTNPLNRNLTPGGSSGGEAALIAMHGSILGIGTDIGGSIRVPAISCGLHGIKPSIARLPHSGLSGTHSGMESIIGVVGPLATNLADLELFCKVLLDSEPWRHEPSLIPLPWKTAQTEKLDRKLKIGIIHSDGVHAPHPPIQRVLKETEKKLIAAGHEIVSFPVHLHEAIATCIDKLYLLDGGAEYWEVLYTGDEPATPLLKWLLEKPTSQHLTISEQWVLHRERSRLQEEYQKLWREAGIDCLICPGGVAAAHALGESKYWGYSSVWNAMDRAVITLPVGEVLESDRWEDEVGDGKRTDMEALWGKGVEGARKYEGASVGLQIVGERLQEERLFGMARVIEEVLR
ncbi:hypothetical protein CJF32_00001847 [Rutstroemia sp. NJR-2017a WRK4]|nr:hypothetical protein CJF32_00001847 [Rutstroemia sp. NJR-2017a WRK4]